MNDLITNFIEDRDFYRQLSIDEHRKNQQIKSDWENDEEAREKCWNPTVTEPEVNNNEESQQTHKESDSTQYCREVERRDNAYVARNTLQALSDKEAADRLCDVPSCSSQATLLYQQSSEKLLKAFWFHQGFIPSKLKTTTCRTHYLAPIVRSMDLKKSKDNDDLLLWAREFDKIARVQGDWRPLCVRARYLELDPECEILPCEIISSEMVSFAAELTQKFFDFAMPSLERVIEESNL